MSENLSYLLPDQVTLGGSTYTIIARDRRWELEEYETHHLTTAGQCRWPDMEVDIVTEGQKATEIANTLIHECLHLCYREFCIKAKRGEERTVTHLGFAITALYKQNPDLLTSIDALLNYTPSED